MKRLVYIVLLVATCIGLTYADGSLWGDIDKPMESAPTPATPASSPPNTAPGAYAAPNAYPSAAQPQAAAGAPLKIEDINAAINPQTPEEQKNVCDVLRSQPELTPETAANLKNQQLPDNVKAALNNPDNAKALYKQFRDQYLGSKCTNIPVSTPASTTPVGAVVTPVTPATTTPTTTGTGVVTPKY